ncbi:MAG: pstB, partial [Gemmatimonadetes bacterium]|nr:pstB [Gemmatimonadota bacterium]
MTGIGVRPAGSMISRPAMAPRRMQAKVDTAHPIVEARAFGFSYGPARILAGITLPIAPQSITAIIGPSGCGKSTFLRSINRLNDLTTSARYEGEILFGGESVFRKGIDLVG